MKTAIKLIGKTVILGAVFGVGVYFGISMCIAEVKDRGEKTIDDLRAKYRRV